MLLQNYLIGYKLKRLTVTNAGKDVEPLQLLHVVRGNGATVLEEWLTLFRQSKYLLPYDPAIPILGIYPKDIKTCVHKKTLYS